MHVDGTATGMSHRVVFKLTFVFADAFTILLGRSFSSNSIAYTPTSMAADDGDHDDGDHGVAPVTRRSYRCFGNGDQGALDDGHIMSLMNCM